MPRMITVLEDCLRYKDGKKWKRRYCFLSKCDSKKGTVTMFITKQFGVNVSNQEMDEKSKRQYLIDEITGYEHGRHVDKESHVMALIGKNIVYCISFESTDTMFRWAETLSKILTSVNFHVTLKKVSETSGIFSKFSAGTQGNLHVQLTRLCLIGEPADGNKFICDWSIDNLISVNIYDTICDKSKKLQIKSNGKTSKGGKGNFEFEIGLVQKSTFEETFGTFLNACKDANPDFKTNFVLKGDTSDTTTDNICSYSIAHSDQNGSYSENSSSFEKRSSEIPIPRSREHSGPDKRPIENAQIKIRKTHSNLQKVRNGIQKHFSAIENIGKHDHDTCLFPDDEEIEDLVHHKSQNLLYSGLSQESSGVFINGASDSMRETDLSVCLSVMDDSGCGNCPSNLLQSTSSGRHHDIDHNALPLCQKICSAQTNIFLTFYRDVNKNPLSLHNYTNYYRLLTTVLDKRSQVMKRSNSFNCVHTPKMKKLENCRKYSHTNFPLNLMSKASERYFKTWKNKVNVESIEDIFLKMQLKENLYQDSNDSLKNLLSHRLPFKSISDFHCSMIRSLQSGTICFNLFSYHHFLLLLKDVKSIVKNINSKVIPRDAEIEYKNWKDKIYRKNKVYNHWLERMQSYNNSCDTSDTLTEPSILDINILLVFEIIDNLLNIRLGTNQELCNIISRRKSYFDTNPIIELNNDKFPLTDTTEDNLSPNVSIESSMYLESRPILCMSCSTPDFQLYCHNERIHKLSNTENRYQNLSSIDTMNHTFPKQNVSLIKPESSDNKEGSFKRLRRKYSPNVFIPFLRRKTSSTHSTLSEPICHDAKEHNSYYNVANQRDIFNKKSLSVVLDSCHYVNVQQGHKYVNVSKNSGTAESNDSSSYINIDSSPVDDDNIPYPEEIIDPSRNYGDLNFIKSRMRYNRQDTENNWLSLRRSSLSILSQKSLQNFGTSRSVSFSKRGYPNISRVHSDAYTNNSSNFRSTDYINTKTLGSSPQSLQSCCPGQKANNPYKNPTPRSLNYVSVIENTTCDNFSHKFSMPLSIYTQNESDHDSGQCQSYIHKRSWLTTPQSSPIIDYCQIDLNCTYALRDIDRMLYDKIKPRNINAPSKNGSPDDVLSFKSLDQMPDSFSVSSSSCFMEKKSHHKHNNNNNKKSFRRMLSRKCGWTN